MSWMRRSFGTLVTLAMALIAGCAKSPPGNPVAQDRVNRVPPPGLLLGRFDDDYGGVHEVLPAEWRQGMRARYRILEWHVADRYLLAVNDSGNPSDPGRFTRIDWITLGDMPSYTWAFCFSAYKAATLAEARATRVARPETPRTGCNGFPYSRLRPSAKE
jgi:hypothetical protein